MSKVQQVRNQRVWLELNKAQHDFVHQLLV